MRDIKKNGHLESFAEHLQDSAEDYEHVYDEFDFASGGVPSYEYYYEAAQEEVPGYKVELAKTGRSQCVKCKANASKKSKAPPRKQKARTQETALVEASTARPRKKARKQETALVEASTAVVKSTGSFAIEKGEIRVGSLDEKSGSYGRWNHLPCWRVPYRVWAGLTNPTNSKQVLQDLLFMEEVLLTNLSALSPEDQELFVEHVMDSSHWARQTKASKPPPNVKAMAEKQKAAQDAKPPPAAADDDDAKPAAAASSSDVAAAAQSPISNSTALTTKSPKAKTHFQIPRPGVNGAIPNCLDGQRFVLTGLFPEVGGGKGLNLGKDKVRDLIEAFGGVVTGSVSGKTNVLIVGKDPGQSKVSKAQEKGIPLVDLATLQCRILGAITTFEDAKPAVITSFSEGYSGFMIAN